MTDTSQQFQVDLRGVVDLLSRHIYSGPRVFLRELLQNAVDAITARRDHNGQGGSVAITPLGAGRDEFALRDDGIGLTAEEVTELLATVGRSSKRDIFDLPREDYLGQFGIGLLSCFMVADEIVIRTRSARGGDGVEWTGRSDGTFRVSPAPGGLPIGTSVHLRPRFDAHDMLSRASVTALAESYGEFLPVSVRVDDVEITRAPTFIDPLADLPAAADYGTSLLGAAPFAVIPLDAPATGTRGVAYVLPYAPPPAAPRTSRVYLGRMLLSERTPDLLPDWAFFVRAVVDSSALSPTASRESLVEDAALETTRTELGAAVRRWVLDLGLSAPDVLAQFVAIHEVALKSLVRHDEELARFITRWLSVETTLGRMNVGDLATRYGRIRCAATVDEYRQIASITEPGVPLVNGGYLYDGEIVAMLPSLYPGLLVEHVDVMSEFERLDPPPLDDRTAALALEARASAALTSTGASASVRTLAQTDIPALYVADPAVLRRMDRGRTAGATSSLWASVLGTIDQAVPASAAEAARLCLNWANPVVRELASVTDDDVFTRSLHLLYVQALLTGQRPLTEGDRALMADALSGLIGASVRGAGVAVEADATDAPAADAPATEEEDPR